MAISKKRMREGYDKGYKNGGKNALMSALTALNAEMEVSPNDEVHGWRRAIYVVSGLLDILEEGKDG